MAFLPSYKTFRFHCIFSFYRSPGSQHFFTVYLFGIPTHSHRCTGVSYWFRILLFTVFFFFLFQFRSFIYLFLHFLRSSFHSVLWFNFSHWIPYSINASVYPNQQWRDFYCSYSHKANVTHSSFSNFCSFP